MPDDPILPPKLPPSHPDHGLECEFVLEPGFQDLLDRAAAAGWGPGIVCVSVIRLAQAQMMRISANAETDDAIGEQLDPKG